MPPRTRTAAPEMTHNIAGPLASLAAPVLNLTLLPGNPRQGDIDALARSLRTFGQRKPVTARRTGQDEHGQPVGYVTAGNHTLLAARDVLGWTHLAVVWVDEDATTAAAWALADNHIAELGTTDTDLLAAMLTDGITDNADLLAATAYTERDLHRLLGTSDDEQGDAGQDDIVRAYGVIVEVSSEPEQVELLERLSGEGLNVRALM